MKKKLSFLEVVFSISLITIGSCSFSAWVNLEEDHYLAHDEWLVILEHPYLRQFLSHPDNKTLHYLHGLVIIFCRIDSFFQNVKKALCFNKQGNQYVVEKKSLTFSILKRPKSSAISLAVITNNASIMMP